MNVKISVVIPVYNVEKYLERCVKSIVEQTYRDLEIILVDDGSTDMSGSICDDWEKRDSRIVVIHQNNAGQATARNRGLEIAIGDYCGFVDSDDWIEPDMYEYCLSLVDIYDVDAVEINYKAVTSENQKLDNQDEMVTIYNSERILEYFMTNTTTTGSYSVCRCLFKKMKLFSIRFRDGKINEDIDYKYMVLANCNSIAVSCKIKYYYFQSGSSTSSGALKRKDFDLYDAAEELYKLTIQNKSVLVRNLGEVKRARTDLSLLCKIAFYGIADPSINRNSTVKQLTKNLRKNLVLLLNSPIPLSRKLMAIALCIHVKLLELPLKVYKKIK